jgi:hypothetical protein
MKKLLSVALIVLVCATSCSKQKKEATAKPDLKKVAQLANAANTTYYPWCNDCFGTPTNCGPVIVIHGTRLDALDAAISLGSTAVSDFFKQPDATDFYPAITQLQLDQLQSGSYSLIKVMSTNPNNPTGICYLAGPAISLTLQNYSFVFPVTPTP